MNRLIGIFVIATVFVIWGFKGASNMAGTQCDPNKPSSSAVAVNTPLYGNGVVDPAAAAKVNMTASLKFDPETVTIEAGQTVLWENTSDANHTVTADPVKAKNKDNCSLPAGALPFDSGTIQPGNTYSQTFTVPGTYKYFCVPHEAMGMTGKVIVNSATK